MQNSTPFEVFTAFIHTMVLAGYDTMYLHRQR